jgi:hypothetical protein
MKQPPKYIRSSPYFSAFIYLHARAIGDSRLNDQNIVNSRNLPNVIGNAVQQAFADVLRTELAFLFPFFENLAK